MTQPVMRRDSELLGCEQSQQSLREIWEFLQRQRTKPTTGLVAASLFSGGGIGDTGYEQSGFEILLQAEIDRDRLALCATNFPNSKLVPGDIVYTRDEIIATLSAMQLRRIDVLSITPPCQGMSSSNPGRGKVSNTKERDLRNKLLLEALPVIRQLHPRVVVVENVMQVLKEEVKTEGGKLERVVEAFKKALPEYEIFAGVVQMADYGIPQMRKRAILVAIHRDEMALSLIKETNLLPWPAKTHAERALNDKKGWNSINDWLAFVDYEPLDAISNEKARSAVDPLHFVPHYEGDEYLRISDIPVNSGQNAYQNPVCHSCGKIDVAVGLVYCPSCNGEMRNRPYVRQEDGTIRLIRGFESSYRRMVPDRPAATVTTNSSHVGSDFKIHPFQNRVLSIRECADLQTVPRYYDWAWAVKTKHTYIARQVIGEAIPAYFTYKHGLLLRDILFNQIDTTRFEKAATH